MKGEEFRPRSAREIHKAGAKLGRGKLGAEEETQGIGKSEKAKRT